MHVKIIVDAQEARDMNDAFDGSGPELVSAPPKRQYVKENALQFKNGSIDDFLSAELNPGNAQLLRNLLRRSPRFLSNVHELLVVSVKPMELAQMQEMESLMIGMAQVIASGNRNFRYTTGDESAAVRFEYARVITESIPSYNDYDFSPYVEEIVDGTIGKFDVVLSIADLIGSMRQTGSRRGLSPEIYELMTMMHTLDVDGQKHLLPQDRLTGTAHGILMLTPEHWSRVTSGLGVSVDPERFAASMDYAPEWIQKLLIGHVLQKHQHIFVDSRVLLTNKESVDVGGIKRWSQLFYGASMLSAVYQHGDNSVSKQIGKNPLYSVYNKRVISKFIDSPLGVALGIKDKAAAVELFRTGPKNEEHYLRKLVMNYWSDENIARMIPDLDSSVGTAKIINQAFRSSFLPVLRDQVLRNRSLGIFARSRNAIIEYTEATSRKATVRGTIELKFDSSQF